MDVKKKSVSLQPISEERVLERVSSTSERVQIIDNIGKDNEVKQHEKQKNKFSYLKDGGTAISRRERESEVKHSEEKVTRADGGCLGFRRRRRTWQAAKRRGDPQAGIDPRMSEWGNPAGRRPVTRREPGANANPAGRRPVTRREPGANAGN